MHGRDNLPRCTMSNTTKEPKHANALPSINLVLLSCRQCSQEREGSHAISPSATTKSAEAPAPADRDSDVVRLPHHCNAPPLWYSVTRVSKKFFSFLRSSTSDIHGNGFTAPGHCSGSPICWQRRLATNWM